MGCRVGFFVGFFVGDILDRRQKNKEQMQGQNNQLDFTRFELEHAKLNSFEGVGEHYKLCVHFALCSPLFRQVLPTKTSFAIHVRVTLPIGACFGRALSKVVFIDGLHCMELRHNPLSISPHDFLSKS